MGEKSAETQGKEIRQWLSTLLTETFFAPCPAHESLKKKSGLKNFLCLDCCSTFCSECPFSQCSHDPRRVLQIRRFLCRDVVRVADLASFIDPSFIQPQICNNARVVFINERKETRPRSTSRSPCLTCGRGLPADCFYCCLNCKVEHLRAEGGLDKLWMEAESLPTPNSTELDESLSTPISTELDESELSPDSSGKTDTSSPSESTASGAAGDTGPSGTTAGSGLSIVPRRRRSTRRRRRAIAGGTGPSGTAAGSGLSNVTRIRRSSIAGGSDLPGPTESGSPNGLGPPKASGLGSTSGSDPRCTTGLGSPNGSDPPCASGLGSTSGSDPKGASGLGAQNRSDQAGTSGLGPPNRSDPRGASGLGSTSGSDPQGASGLGPPNRSDPRGTSGSGSRHRRKGISRRASFF